MSFKNYKLRTKKGKEYYMLARHNRDAMKLAGRLVKVYGEIDFIEDEDGNIIIQNS